MTDLQRDRLAALARCTFMPGCWDKRFVQGVWGLDSLTDAQLAQVDRMAWEYRRQMPTNLVPAKP